MDMNHFASSTDDHGHHHDHHRDHNHHADQHRFWGQQIGESGEMRSGGWVVHLLKLAVVVGLAYLLYRGI